MQLTSQDFKEGKILLVNKPLTWTSFDVVNKIRYALRPVCGKIKVGHAGTLDPLATGLLLIATGKATKQIAGLQGMDKEYTGIIRVGSTTPSYDLETEPDATFPIDHLTDEMIRQAAVAFKGEILQLPPLFSAIKREGKKLYKIARKGGKVEVPPRQITIHSFDIKNINLPDIAFRVHCGKGTYIRSLAYDFGKALNSGAHLAALERTAIGENQLKNAWQLDDLVSHIKNIGATTVEQPKNQDENIPGN